MTERPHFRTVNHSKSSRVRITIENGPSLTPDERHRLQYDFTPETNMGRAALGCGTEDWTGIPSVDTDSSSTDDYTPPEPEFPQD